MDLYRAGEAVLRSSQPLLPFLAPAAYRQPQHRAAAVARHCKARLQCQTTRTFTTTLRRKADTPPESSSGSSQTRAPTASDDISSILNESLDGSKGTPTAPATRTSRFASNTAQPASAPSRASASLSSQSGGSSMDDLLNSMVDISSGRKSTSTPSRSSFGGYDDISRLLDPKARGVSRQAPAIQPAPMKLGPTLGRTVHVDKERGFDVAKAFRTMEIQVARNAVRRDFNKQRFYERPGMKRKRLKSERWRRRFKEGFRAAVRRVLKMRKQGW